MSDGSTSVELPPLEAIIDRQPIIVSARMSIGDVRLLLSTHDQVQPYLLVMENHHLVGIVSHEAVRAMERRDANELIGAVMTPQRVTLTWEPELEVRAVVKFMYHHQLEYLVMVDEQHQVVGAIAPDTLRQGLQSISPVALYYELSASGHESHKKREETTLAGTSIEPLDFPTLLHRTVGEVREKLNCDRAIIYRFEPNGSGTVIAESVDTLSQSLLGQQITDPHFAQHLFTAYQHGQTQVTDDIESGELTPCHVELLRQIQVRANLVVPIVQDEHLWGLMAAQQSLSRRTWYPHEERFLKHRAEALAIALKQALLFQDTATQEREHQWKHYVLEQERNFTQAILSVIEALVIVVDRHGQIVYFNPACERLSGYTQSQSFGQQVWEYLIPLAEQNQVRQRFETLLQGGTVPPHHHHWVTHRGSIKRIEWTNRVIRNDQGMITHAIATGIDITKRDQAEQQLQFRDRQQQTLAYLHHTAIAQPDLNTLMTEIVQTIAKTLQVDQVQILELLPNQAAFALKAEKSIIPHRLEKPHKKVEPVTISAGKRTQAGYTLHCGQSVVVEDLRVETRFQGSYLLHERRIISGVTAIIPGLKHPFGILGVHTTEYRQFTPDEVQFVEAIANLIATALQRHQATEELNQFFNLSLDLFCIVGIDSTIKRINPRFQSLLGYTSDQILSTSWLQYIHQDDRAATATQIQQIARGTPAVNIEHRYQSADGTYRWIAWTAMPADEPYFYAVGRDVTERRQIEIALKQSQQRYAALASASPVGIVQTDPHGRCVYVNQRWSDITGITAAAAKHLPTPSARLLRRRCANAPGWWQTLHPDEHQRVIPAWLKAARQQHPFAIETRIQHRDGKIKWVIIQAEPEEKEPGVASGYVVTITDISDRKQAEEALKYLNQTLEEQVTQRTAELQAANEALRYAEERFRIALKNAPIIVFNQDLNQRYTWIYSPGLNYGSESMVGKSDADLFGVEGAKQFRQIKEQVLKSQVSVREEVVIGDTPAEYRGDFKCYDLTVDPLLNLDGEVIGITCAALDITHRKKSELALQESERFIQRVADASPNILYIYELEEKRNIYANQNIALRLGYTPEEIQEMGSEVFSRLMHPEDQRKVAQYHQKIQESTDDTIREIEYRMRDRQGTWHWFISRDTIFSRNSQGQPKQILGAASDITQRKQVEEKLRLSERAIAASSNGIVIVDAQQPDFPVISVNPAFEQVTGYQADEILGRNCRFLQGKDRNQPELKKIRQALKSHQNCTVVLRNYRKDGSLFWNRLSISPIHDEQGNLTHYLGIQNNITEIKLVEEQLLQKVKKEQLFGIITKRIRESLDLKEILQTAVREIKQVLEADRVLVYRVLPNYIVKIIAENVNEGWPSIRKQTFPEETFLREYYESYIQGKIYVISNVEEDQFNSCLGELLRNYNIQAKIAVPIIDNQLLWGLLIVHQCNRPRNWQDEEIELLTQIASQLAIAIQQSQFYKRLQAELQERIAIENALLMSQKKLHYLLSSSPGILYSFRAQGDFKLTFISDNSYDLTGYHKSEMLTRGFWINHLEPNDRKRILEAGLNQLFEQGYYSHEYRFLHRNGHYIWIYDQLNLIRDEQGNPLEVIGYWIDISDRKKIEEKLQETTSRLTSLISNLQLGVLVKDEHGKIALINQAFCDLFEINNSSNRFIGKEFGILADEFKHLFINAEHAIKEHQQIIARKQIVTNQEIVLKDGRVLEQNYVPIFIDSVDRGHLWMYRDISDRKQAESRLVTSLQEKEILLKEIHHRVKNNLLVVSNLLEFQADYINDPGLVKVLEDSRNRIYSMALIHEKLYRSMNLDTINFGEYLEDLVHNLFESYNIEDNRVTFELDLQPIFLNIETAHPCGLIVNELLSNTLKHAFPGSRKGKVNVLMTQNNKDQIIVRVADNGIGFPAHLDFRHVDSLGMELVCTLTEQLEGEITLNREGGTTFELKFAELNYRQRV